MGAFERFLSLWVALCMAAGIAFGTLFPGAVAALRGLELGAGSHVNAAIMVLIWLMVAPMMARIDFPAIRNVGREPRGLAVTLFVNWFVKPFSMALLAWFFFRHAFAPWVAPADADQYIAGTIILAAAPCTAMVFVWSALTRGDPAYTLVQVALNDLVMLVLFVPIVRILVRGASSLEVPMRVLVTSVVAFLVVPLAVGAALRAWVIARRGKAWLEGTLLPRLAPLTVGALLLTLVAIFAFQAENVLRRPLHVALIAVPILLQVLLNASLAYGLMKLAGVRHAVAAPGSLIGASNFFELAVATSLALFGPGSGAALATTVGVLVEVPVMLMVCAVCNRTRGWFEPAREAVSA